MTENVITLFEIFEIAAAKEVYGRKLVELGRKHENIVVLSADLLRSNNIKKFEDEFPERTFNVGVAEQNLLGIAAGLALEGKMPFASTMATFASMRACEQLRTDICYNNLNVRIIATNAGLTSGAGPTHSSQEDISIVKSFPNLTVISPGDPNQIGKVIEASLTHNGPIYIRIGRSGEPVIYQEDYHYEIGKAITVKEGMDLTFIACGVMVSFSLFAAQLLEKEGISARVIDMHTIKPIDEEVIEKAVTETGRILVAEDHNMLGGLASSVADILADKNLSCTFKRVGIPNVYCAVGNPEGLYAKYGMDVDGIYAAAKSILS